MKFVFADSGHWIALLDRRDPLHDKALALSRRLYSQRIKIITRHIVFGEVLDYFASAGRQARIEVARTVADALADPNIEVISQTAELFDRARALYERRDDKEWGFVDCSSFVIMEERGINEALAHDHYFEQAGFKALFRE